MSYAETHVQRPSHIQGGTISGAAKPNKIELDVCVCVLNDHLLFVSASSPSAGVRCIYGIDHGTELLQIHELGQLKQLVFTVLGVHAEGSEDAVLHRPLEKTRENAQNVGPQDKHDDDQRHLVGILLRLLVHESRGQGA